MSNKLAIKCVATFDKELVESSQSRTRVQNVTYFVIQVIGILDLRPPSPNLTGDLIYDEFDWRLIRAIWRPANYTVTAVVNGVVDFESLVRRQVVMHDRAGPLVGLKFVHQIVVEKINVILAQGAAIG